MIKDDFEMYWLAGLLEGEGSFLKGPPSKPASCSIVVHMTDEDIVMKIANIFETSYYETKKQQEHHKRAFRVSKRGTRCIRIDVKIIPVNGQQTTITN